MRKSVIVSAVAVPGLASLFSASTVAAAVQPELVGGSEAARAGWPRSSTTPRTTDDSSGAALLFRSSVVTNAHCVTDMPGNPPGQVSTSAKIFSVRVGSEDRTTGAEVAKVVKIVVHPGWQWAAGAPAQTVDDVAMLQLDHAVNMQPIRLVGRVTKPGDRVTLYGLGRRPAGRQPGGWSAAEAPAAQYAGAPAGQVCRRAAVGRGDLHQQPARHPTAPVLGILAARP